MEPIKPAPPQHSPRRELQLQGPRPTPLRLNTHSHKIKKPPLPPPKDPIIIYTISPKVIHVELADFMCLVQRLTGPTTNQQPLFSPAAKLATIHNTSTRLGNSSNEQQLFIDDVDVEQLESVERGRSILSPIPSLMPPVSPGFFSPSYLDPSFLGFLHELSPGGLVGRQRSPVGGSPGKFLSSPMIPSPGSAFWDLFNHL